MKTVAKNEVWESWHLWQLHKLRKRVNKFFNLGFSFVESFLTYMFQAKVIRRLGPGENDWEVVERKNLFSGF